MKESATSLKQILPKPCSTCCSGKVNFCQITTRNHWRRKKKNTTTTKTPARFEEAHHSSSLFLWVLFSHFLLLSFCFLNIFNLQVSQFLLKTATSLGEEFPCILTDKMASAEAHASCKGWGAVQCSLGYQLPSFAQKHSGRSFWAQPSSGDLHRFPSELHRSPSAENEDVLEL